MAYTPPSTPLNGSWSGASDAMLVRGRLRATWSASSDQHIYQPIGASGVVSAPTLKWQQYIEPEGSGAPEFGSAWASYPGGYVRPQFRLDATWLGALSYLPPQGALGVTWSTAVSYVDPSPILPPDLGTPVVTQQQVVLAEGFATGVVGEGHYALFSWQYPVPEWVLNASWVGRDDYTPATATLNAAWTLPAEAKQVSLAGWDSLAFGVPMLPVVAPAGFNAQLIPSPNVHNLAAPLRPSGFNAQLFGQHSIWNWLQHIRGSGFLADRFGTSYVQGGVKTLAPGGIASFVAGRPVVINTTADQFIALNARGIAPPDTGRPNVSPRTLWPAGIYATGLGFPWVQFPPRPSGWLSSAFGYPVVEDKAKYVSLSGIAAPDAGFPLIRDLAQTVRHAASPITSVFGDVQVRLLSQYLRPAGVFSQEFGGWSEVRSMRRFVYPQGATHTSFGGTEIANKTPALWPAGFASQAFGGADVGFYYRTVAPAGVIPPYPQVMPPTLTQTPSLRPAGIAPPAMQRPTVWPAVRGIGGNGWDSQRFGIAMAAFSWRRVTAEGHGIHASAYGVATLQHAVRTIQVADGLSFMAFGGPWLSRGQRFVEPEGIDYPYMSNHMVGTTRYVGAVGWESTRWLTRIIPENQLLEQRGARQDLHGLAKIENATRSLLLQGITTYPEPSMHWGVARVWNLRQVVTLTEDLEIGLAPPAWPQWTLIENRNKIIGALGFAATRYGYTEVANNARAILLAGMAAPELPPYQRTGSVTHRVRPLPVAGIEAPPISGWSVVYNKAFPLKPPSFLAERFGVAHLENTRRYRKVEGFDAYAFGHAFVSFAIRELTFESRYGIQPPPIRLPNVHLFTRYIEPPSIDDSKVAQQSLVETRFNRLRPNWPHRDLFGEATLRNRTPEYRMRGWDTSLWGDTHVRLQWRPIQGIGYDMQIFGRAIIADRTRALQPNGFNGMVVSDKVSVRRIGADPVVTQYIDLRRLVVDEATGEVHESDIGYGIAPSPVQLGTPNLLKGYIFHGKPIADTEMTLWGTPHVTANTIRVEPGYGEHLVGEPFVSQSIRRIEVPTMGQLVQDSVDTSDAREMGSWGKPRLSPHTIYAVLEAPEQAKRNHGFNTKTLRAVNAGIRLGSPVVSQWLGEVKPNGIPSQAFLGAVAWGVGRPTIYNKRQVVAPFGTLMQRIGWPVIPGQRTIVLEDEDALIGPARFGAATISRPPPPPIIRPPGVPASAFGFARVEHFHRVLVASGFFSQAMGSSRDAINASMPQSLHVGPPHLHPVVGFDASGYGVTWVSMRVRELAAEGWDSFLCEYQLEQFNQRMRVRRTVVPIPAARITPVGIAAPQPSAPHVMPGAHFIRPDGNADQYRKGAF